MRLHLPRCPARVRKRVKAAILFDALIATGILGMGAFAIFSLLPTVYQGQTFASQETMATQMSSRLVENLQMLAPSNMTAETLTTLNLIDGGQTKQPFSFSKIPLDDSARYSPATALPKGTGVLELETLADGCVKARVVITWESPFGQRSITSGTVVGGYR